MGPGWVQEPAQQPHPKSSQVVFIPDVALVFTPCHGAGYAYAQDEAVPGAWLDAVCNDCGARLTVELHADLSQEFGLRAEWADPGAEVAR